MDINARTFYKVYAFLSSLVAGNIGGSWIKSPLHPPEVRQNQDGNGRKLPPLRGVKLFAPGGTFCPFTQTVVETLQPPVNGARRKRHT